MIRFEIDFDANPAFYSPNDLADRQARFLRLLTLISDPQRAIGSLDILSAAERHTIIRDWNDTTQPIADATVPALFAAQAQRTPEAVAVVFEDRSLSYAALEAHANQLAHHLQSLGVGPEVIVGLCVERSPEMVIGLLGILKAGGAYLPLDPEYPAERLAFMLSDAGATVLLTQSGPIERLSAVAAAAATTRIVRLDADWPDVARQPTAAPKLELHPQHPAYVIYTSGSTGTPKGVVVEHAKSCQQDFRHWHMVSMSGPAFGPRLSFRLRSMLRSSRRCYHSSVGGRSLLSAMTFEGRLQISGTK